MNELNIQKIWAKTNFESYDFTRIIHEHRNRSNSTLTTKFAKKHYNINVVETHTHTSSKSSIEFVINCEIFDDKIRIVFMTSYNEIQIQKFLKQIENMFEDVVEITQKINKFVVHVLTNATLLNDQTKQLMNLIIKKNSKKQRQKNALSNAMIMNQKMFDDKRLHWNWNIVWKKLIDIHLNVCQNRKTKSHEIKKARWEKIMKNKKNFSSKNSKFFKKKTFSIVSFTKSNASFTKLKFVVLFTKKSKSIAKLIVSFTKKSKSIAKLIVSFTKKSWSIASLTKIKLIVSFTKKSKSIISFTKSESVVFFTKSKSIVSFTKKKTVVEKKKIIREFINTNK